MKYSIETFDLVKKYDKFLAVDNLNFKVKDKSIFGFLGPNGAGKTTTIKMLTCLFPPTSGTAQVAGYDVLKSPNDVRKKIGVIPQNVSLYGELTVRENILFCADFYGVPKDIQEERADELMEMVDIKYAENKLIRQLSGGMKQKASVVASLIHQPNILFLDEPTIGLDPTTKRILWDLMEELNSEGHTIVLCSHDMYEVEKLCDELAIINKGNIVAFDTPQGLKDHVINEEKSSNVEISHIIGELKKLTNNENPILEKDLIKSSLNFREISFMVNDMDEKMVDELKELLNVVEITRHHSGRINLKIVDSKGVIAQIINVLMRYNSDITSINTKDPSLDDVFMKVTQEAKEDGNGEK